MTAATMEPAVQPAPAADRLRRDIRLMDRATGGLQAAPAAVARNAALIRETAERWTPAARERCAAAAGSAADQRRWDTLLAATTCPPSVEKSFTNLLVSAGAVRALLRALLDSLLPSPTVLEIARQITEAVHRGHYPIGSCLPPRRVAADLTVPAELVRLAVSDLVDAGVLTQRAKHVVVNGSAEEQHRRAAHLADRLRAQIEAGVYPPETNLPSATDLAAAFVCDRAPVVRALRQLDCEGLVRIRSDRKPTQVLEATRSLQPPVPRVPPPNHCTTSVFSDEEILAAARTAREQWAHRADVPTRIMRGQWQELRAMARQLLAPGPRHERSFRWEQQVAFARAAEAESVPLPGEPWLQLWHTACVGAAVAGLLAPSQGDRP